MVTDINIRPETMKLLAEKIRAKVLDIGLDNGHWSSIAQDTKAKINKWDYN